MKLWPPVRARPPIIQREFRGVNRLNPSSLSEVFATDGKNMSASKYPSLSVRPGYGVLGASFGRVLGIGAYKESELHAIFGDGTWRKWTGNAWSVPLKSGLNQTALWSFTNFKGNLPDISLVAANGVDPMQYYDGNTVQVLATAPAGGKFVEQYADRLWCAVGNTLYCSAYRMANDWTTVNQDAADSAFIEVETPNGELIDGIVSNSTTLVVSKASSIHKLFGYSADDFSLRRVTKEVGFMNNNCAVIIRGVLYFLDSRGIYEYSGSTLPDNSFSLPMKEYIDRMHINGKWSSCVGTDGNMLYVAIPLDGADLDTILTYDFQAKAWEVWKGFTPSCFGKLNNNLYVGETGRLLQSGGLTDNLAMVEWSRVSIPYSAQSMSQKVRWNRMWFVASLLPGSTINVYLSKLDTGDTDWQLVKTITATDKMESTPIYIPTNVVANANWIRYKLEGKGPVEIKEFAREETQMPIR